MLTPRLIVVPFLFALSACGGGGGGGGNDDVVFAGTIVRTSSTTTTTAGTAPASRPIERAALVSKARCPTTGEGIEICALESCATSSSTGEWSFSVGNFGGGDVDFSFRGCDVDAEATLENLDEDSRRIEVDFSVLDEDTVTFASVSESDDPEPEPESSPTESAAE